jgi:NTE family protein
VSEHLDEVIVVAPLVTYESDRPRSAGVRLEGRLRQHRTRRLDEEVRRPTAGGTTVKVIAPTAEDLAVTGANLIDAPHRRAVFDTALRTTRARLAEVPAS